MKTFALDVYEAKKLGTGEWQKDFFWPVSDQEFFSIVDAVANAFLKELEREGQTLQDILLANDRLVRRSAWFLHALLVNQRLTSQGYTGRCSEKWKDFWGISKEGRSDGVNKASKIRWGRMRRAAKFFLRNRFTAGNVSHSLRNREYVMSLGTFSRIKREYCRQEEGIIFHRLNTDYLGRVRHRTDGRGRALAGTVRSLTETIAEVGKGWGLPLGENDFPRSRLENMISGMIGPSYDLYQGILEGPCRRADRVLLSETAKVENKTICLALKRRFGSEIVAFEHGNTFGSLISKFFAVRELAHCDKYVVSTSRSIPNYEQSREVSVFPYGTGTEIVSVDSDYYLSIWERNRNSRVSSPKKIESVMLIGFPMDPYRYPELPAHFSLFHLDLELRLMRFLKERGLRVIYKAHPDTAAEAEKIFDGLADEICFEPFERVSDKGDAHLFTHTDTSTFGIALCGVKPIIVIELGGKTWNQESFRLISKRCRMVPGGIDERNRIVFDEMRLRESLEEEITDPNTEFLERFMFPRG